MKTKNNTHLLTFLCGLSCLYTSPTYAADETATERMSHHQGLLYGTQPVVTNYRVTYHRHTNFAVEEINRNFEEASNFHDPQSIADFIQKGIKEYPLPTEQNPLLEDLAWHNEKDRITKAISDALINKDVKSICYLGSVYMKIDEHENAKPWLFYAADKNDSTAFWLLASLQHSENLLVPSADLATLEQKLLEKSASLGNSFALEALGLNGQK